MQNVTTHENENWWLMLKKMTVGEYLGWSLMLIGLVLVLLIIALLIVAVQLRAAEEIGDSNDSIKMALLLLIAALPCIGIGFFLVWKKEDKKEQTV